VPEPQGSVPPVIIGCGNLVAGGDGYLLVKESKPSTGLRYNLPSGKPEVGETLAEAARREAREEAGIDVVVDGLVGIYHCPATSEGFGVVNFVFSSTAVGGDLTPSAEHPEVAYVPRSAIESLHARHLLRGNHIVRAIEDLEAGRCVPLSLIQLVPPEPLPTH
jgi:ADP-ribose pyrophosphatase YjhB (NUDIX family)